MPSRSQRRHHTAGQPVNDRRRRDTLDSDTSSSSGERSRAHRQPEKDRRARHAAYTTYPASSSEDVYSVLSETENPELHDDYDEYDSEEEQDSSIFLGSENGIPLALPAYTPRIVDTSVQPSTPQSFASLFPSRDRLSIRHDGLTLDGNMNLRVDALASSRSRSRRGGSSQPVAVQLFHLRMNDLARREFSLRRYARDSGREVCNSRRAAPAGEAIAAASRPGLQRSVSSAIRSVRTPFSRSSAASSLFKRRPSTGGSVASSDSTSVRSADALATVLPSNTMRLEFSNYARVDIQRRGGSRSGSPHYDFAWWGHQYSWQRVVDKYLGVVSFHLVRDGRGAPVAHVVPETRSPTQVEADERAGGWVPPCYFWISDESVIHAMTDVADVVVATGLIALVDDCIKDRWESPTSARRSHKNTRNSFTSSLNGSQARTLIPSLFSRGQSTGYFNGAHQYGSPVTAY